MMRTEDVNKSSCIPNEQEEEKLLDQDSMTESAERSNTSSHSHSQVHSATSTSSLTLAFDTLNSSCDQDSNSVHSESNSTKTGRSWHSVKSKNITLDRLIKDGILVPAASCLSVKYLGQILTADLLEDGKIRATDTGVLFNTPSSWAIHCKRSINPAKTSGCGWSSIRYKGKSLDVYKTKWLSEMGDSSPLLTIPSSRRVVAKRPIKKELRIETTPTIDYKPLDSIDSMYPCMSQLPLSEYEKNLSTQVRCEGFDVSLKTVFNPAACIAMAQLSQSSHEEISGYLSGRYDSVRNIIYIQNMHSKSDTQARQKISNSGEKLVGWFHSHPTTSYHPTVYDVECHLNYQLRLREQPLVACIIGQKHPVESPALSMLCYTVAPPKLKFSERFGCLSDKCGKPKFVQWNLEPNIGYSTLTTDPELLSFLQVLERQAMKS